MTNQLSIIKTAARSKYVRKIGQPKSSTAERSHKMYYCKGVKQIIKNA